MVVRLCAFADEADKNLDGQICALKENGIALIELRNVNGKSVADFTDKEAIEVYQKLSQNGISVWSVGSPLGKTDINGDYEQYVRSVHRICQIANLLKSKYVRMFSFFNAYEQEEEVVRRLQKSVEIANTYGVTLCHENEKDIFGDTLARVQILKRKVQGMAHVYDPANYIQTGERAADTLSLVGDTFYFHVKDVIASTEEIVPAGYGDGAIGEILDRIDGEKVFSVEPHLRHFVGYDAIDGSVMKNKFTFASNREAFDCAVNSLKDLLVKKGFAEKEKGKWIK